MGPWCLSPRPFGGEQRERLDTAGLFGTSAIREDQRSYSSKTLAEECPPVSAFQVHRQVYMTSTIPMTLWYSKWGGVGSGEHK